MAGAVGYPGYIQQNMEPSGHEPLGRGQPSGQKGEWVSFFVNNLKMLCLYLLTKCVNI